MFCWAKRSYSVIVAPNGVKVNMESVGKTISHMKSYDHMRVNKLTLHKNHKTVNEVDFMVQKLHSTYLNSEQYKPLFRKACWHLSEGYIVGIIERSREMKVPLAYFVACVKAELRKVST